MPKTLFTKHLEILKISLEKFSKSTNEKLISLLVIKNGGEHIVNSIYDLLQNENAEENDLLALMEKLKLEFGEKEI